jgi:hypothetical protein
MLAFESFTAQHVAGQVKGISPRKLGKTQLSQPDGKSFNGKSGSSPGTDGILLADLAAERDKRSVNLVLN